MFDLPKMRCASENDSISDSIAALRSEIEAGNSVPVTPTGEVAPTAEDASSSSVSEGTGFKQVPKSVVAVDDDSISDSIATLRSEIEAGNSVPVTPTGEVAPSAEGSSTSSVSEGTGFKQVPKSVVAADDSSVADAIETLRSELVDGNTTYVNSDGTIHNPADPMTESSVTSGSEYKPVPKAVVASDSSVQDAIETLRSQLVGGGETQVNQDGTIYNPADPVSASSVTSGSGFKPVDKAVVAVVQWYRKNPALQQAEITAMMDIKPDAKWGYLPNGRMYWTVRLFPVVCGKRKDWTLLAVYDDDHPQARWGGSVKFYPVKPSYKEMQALVNRSFVTPKNIPHMLQDDEKVLYMCTNHYNNIHAGQKKGELVTTAATCLRFAMRWINVFELGLIDQKTWTHFQHHGEI